MPFLQRVIEPVHVCRNALPLDDQGALTCTVPNELECVTNGTLANIIRQLSSLAKHGEDLFSSLFRESSAILQRSNSLLNRIDRLAVKVTQLDSTIEEVSLQDITSRKAFKSSIVFEQQVVSRESMSAAVREMYQQCDKPPPLDKLNPYRDDGKDGLKFYTDPGYFFDLWKQEMLKDTERNQHERPKKVPHAKEIAEQNMNRVKPECRKHRKSRQSHAARDRYKITMVNKDGQDTYYQQYGTINRTGNHVQANAQRPNSLEIHSSYFNRNYVDADGKPQYPPPPPAYTEHPISPQQHYPPPPYVPLHQRASPNGTPTRTASRTNSHRPSIPPPAPPSSNSSSGSSTPTVSASTPLGPTGKQRRDNLPKPPPPPVAPEEPSKSLQRRESQQSTELHKSPEPKEERYKINSPKGLFITSPKHNGVASPEKINHQEANLPPPPPLPPSIVSELKLRNNNKANNHDHVEANQAIPVAPPAPPPPPPLPPLEDLVLDSVENGSLDHQNMEVVSITSESASETSSVSKFSENFDAKTKHNDGRSDLLAAIREGIKLRRVEDSKQKEVEKAAPLHDVASILARRVAMEFSDSDSPASGSDNDSDAWDEEPAKT